MQCYLGCRWWMGLLVLATITCDLNAQKPAPARRSPVGIMRFRSLNELARMKGVQKELGLTDVASLNALQGELRKAMSEEQAAAGIGGASLRALSGKERLEKLKELQPKMDALAKMVNERFDDRLREVLTADQFKRLREIFIQASGADALAHEAVAKELALSEEQMKRIGALIEEWNQAANPVLLGGAVTDPAGTLVKMQELHQKMQAKAKEILDADQQKKLRELQGKPFDFTLIGSG